MFAEIGGKRDRSGLAAAIEEAQAMPQDQREKMTPEGQDEVDALRYLGSIYDQCQKNAPLCFGVSTTNRTRLSTLFV